MQDCGCIVHGKNHITNSYRVQQRNPSRVVEAVHESSARISEIVPDHPDRLPGAERITPIIYVGGELAESNNGKLLYLAMIRQYSRLSVSKGLAAIPLREIVRFAQGIALLKINEKSRFSCNSTGGLQ